MDLTTVALFYLVIGIPVSVAFAMQPAEYGGINWFLVMATVVFFWPLYLPGILAARSIASSRDGVWNQAAPHADNAPQDDELAAAIAEVESELATALAGLSGWAEDVLAKEQDRIGELQGAWRSQAQKIRDIDALLAATAEATAEENTPRPESTVCDEAQDRCRRSRQARNRNLKRLAQVRMQAREELMSTLAWVRELVSMIHLARFTGAPAARAEELVAQIAAAVEGVSAVTWHDEENEPLTPPHHGDITMHDTVVNHAHTNLDS